MFPLVSVCPLFFIEKDGNLSVLKLRFGVPLCPPNSRGTVAALESFLVTNFHSDISGEAVVRGHGVEIPEGFSKFSIVAAETSRACSTICGSMFAWISPDVFSG